MELAKLIKPGTRLFLRDDKTEYIVVRVSDELIPMQLLETYKNGYLMYDGTSMHSVGVSFLSLQSTPVTNLIDQIL